MKPPTLVGVGLVLAAVAELQWASAFFAHDDAPLALLMFVAGAGSILAAMGAFFGPARAWAFWGGLAVAALSHVAFFFATLDFGGMLVLAAGLAGVGLALAAWASRTRGSPFVRIGLALAAAGGLTRTVADLTEGSTDDMVGNVFATIGWALAATFATRGSS